MFSLCFKNNLLPYLNTTWFAQIWSHYVKHPRPVITDRYHAYATTLLWNGFYHNKNLPVHSNSCSVNLIQPRKFCRDNPFACVDVTCSHALDAAVISPSMLIFKLRRFLCCQQKYLYWEIISLTYNYYAARSALLQAWSNAGKLIFFVKLQIIIFCLKLNVVIILTCISTFQHVDAVMLAVSLSEYKLIRASKREQPIIESSLSSHPR